MKHLIASYLNAQVKLSVPAETIRKAEAVLADFEGFCEKRKPPCKVDPSFLCDELTAKPTADGLVEDLNKCLAEMSYEDDSEHIIIVTDRIEKVIAKFKGAKQ